MKIGIINHHGDFTQLIKNIIPDNHEVFVYDMNTTEFNDSVDIMCTSFAKGNQDIIKSKFFALPYGTPLLEEIEEINRNPLCIGILDMSSSLKKRFSTINKPVWEFQPVFPELPIYRETGTKVISLVNKYQERFPKEYELAKTITDEVYGSPDRAVDDVAALKDAKWLLHLKPEGFTCNAVLKAVSCGIPVITDTHTHNNTFLENIVKHDDNGIVLPADQIKNYLNTVDEATYKRIKANCVAQSEKLKTPVKWRDGWWEQPTKGGFIPSVMGGVMKAGPYFMTAAVAQGSRLLRNNRSRMASRRNKNRKYTNKSRRRRRAPTKRSRK